MNNAIIMAGIPGSGKSTIREKFIKKLDDFVFIYSTDDYIEDIANIQGSSYNYVWDTYIREATEIQNQRLADEISKGTDVLWDQTNVSVKKRKWAISKFPKYYSIKCVCIVPPRNKDEENELFTRLENRKGKHIPNHIIANMIDSFATPEKIEGFDEVILYNIYGDKINE
jgi:tRNA uridine 5-carbamoylmethylation protein Kti12